MHENAKTGLLITSLVLNAVCIVWLVGLSVVIGGHKGEFERLEKVVVQQNKMLKEAIKRSYD